MSKKGFTLIEVLVVTAILAILAGLLFPVFALARNSAYSTACASNLRQLSAATSIYTLDYDDRMVLVSYQPVGVQNSRTDRTWVQLLLPYVRDFRTFVCPSDNGHRTDRDSTFDQDLVPGDSYSAYYTMSQHVDYGYNFQYLSPIYLRAGKADIQPKSTTSARTPSSTVLFVDSVHDRDSAGNPIDGGNWLVVPPCRYYREDVRRPVIDTFNVDRGSSIYTPSTGWELKEQNSSAVYGGAWPWHRGRMNVAMLDGSVRFMNPVQISAGCDLRPEWQGWIKDLNVYLWNLE